MKFSLKRTVIIAAIVAAAGIGAVVAVRNMLRLDAVPSQERPAAPLAAIQRADEQISRQAAGELRPAVDVQKQKSPSSPTDPAGTAASIPENAIVTVVPRKDCRSVSAKQDWPVDFQRKLGLISGCGRAHESIVHGYVSFDLSSVDLSRPLHSATLVFQCLTGPAPETRNRLNQVVIGRLLRAVRDNDLRWFRHPVSPEGQQLVHLKTAGTYEVDVTAIVSAWLSGQPNHGLQFESPENPCRQNWKHYDSTVYDPKTNPGGIRLVIRQWPSSKQAGGALTTTAAAQAQR